MTEPRVSIIILNYNSPQIIDICLRSLTKTEGVDYEVVVVDNGSEPAVVEQLKQHQAEGRITTLVPEPINHFFSEGNNIGVRYSNPASEFVLLLNSDVAILRPDWLTKVLAWADGTIEYWPSVWGLRPTTPDPGPRDIVSVGWSHDSSVIPSRARPEGFCCLIRRTVWREMSPDLPWHGGFEEMIANVVRAGAKAGVLSQYGSYLVHREGASGKIAAGSMADARQPDIPKWFRGLVIETLDFTLGPDEHSSYLWW
jgi:glycosyltransferase involved in cell wall biosynthesis